jgi:hypothetical protein
MKSKENIERLKRLQWLEIQSTRILGGWLPGLSKWETKGKIALHLWEDAQRSQQLRTRLWELRVPAPDRNLSGNPAEIPVALSKAQEDFEFLAGHYLVFKKTLLEEYKHILATTHQVWDAPSLPVLRLAISGLESQIEWAHAELEELADSGEKQRRIQRWMQFITDVMAAESATTGFGGETPKPLELPEPPPGYSASPLPFGEAKRDARFKMTLTGPVPPEEDDTLGKTIYQFVNYAHEMQAAETLGSVLWETNGMEWEFYFDVARHCYDEARHSELGESRLRELGHHITDFPHTAANYAWRQLIDPMRRYCVLTYVIEADSFEYKHKSYNRYVELQDTTSAESILFDIIDETLHLRWGKKWTPKLMEQNGYTEPLENLVTECRDILLRHAVNPIQRASAQKAGSEKTKAAA